MTKKEVNSALCAFAVKTAFAIANAKAEKEGKKLEIKNGRKLSVPDFVEYLENVGATADISAQLTEYLTSEKPHAFEIAKISAEQKRREREESEAKIFAEFGF